MNGYKVTFENGDSFVTGMNATLEEARRYYIGTAFQFGDTEEIPRDYMVRAVVVEPA